ncbi:hypothetical protein CJD36_011085 [Flavipsychrobacter stenotrophus]|uniref:FeoB-associated Cys-rich membrane protein n=1 Tax=Flavipsychrobacter stenotrophus TaxID=2077091 RepID=A0A2S7SW81_9BACT|nr:hypothetical protein CJD36_011085 [Flavipsychrobacter stenotrophus]
MVFISLLLMTSTMSFAGKCSGGKNCTACKNCKYCKNCSKEGGSCSVCSSTIEKPMKSKSQKKKH